MRAPRVLRGTGRAGFNNFVVDVDGLVRRGLLFMDDDEDAGVPPPPDPTQQADAAATVGEGSTDASDAGATPAAPDTAVAVVTPPDPTDDNGGGQTDDVEAEGEASPLVRQAVDALVANRQRDAYRLYGQLAEENPEEPAYAALRDILRRRVQASCSDGVDPQGNPCEQIE